MVIRYLTLFALLAAACTAPQILENTKEACSNGIDDDGNGLTDCDDPACDGSGACETTKASCTNGLDDDHDGATDCEDTQCVTKGYCDQYATTCDPFAQTGCPVGMGCYRHGTTGGGFATECRLAGQGKTAYACTVSGIDALGARDPHPCAAGFGCATGDTDNGVCGIYCQTDDDCGAVFGSVCRPSGICTAPCDPRVAGSGGCRLPYKCISRHEIGVSFASGGAYWTCQDGADDIGTAANGAACVDPPLAATPRTQICAASLACYNPGTSAPYCDDICSIGIQTCTGGMGICSRLYPDGTPSGTDSTTFGICL